MFKKTLSKSLILLAISILSLSCVTTRLTNVPNSSTISSFENDRIEILGKAEGSASGARIWALFIPIGWAGDNWCNNTAYKRALKNYPNADGLIDQVTNYHRTRVPLILLTPVVKKVKVKGTAYHIRTDVELAEYLKNKKQRARVN